MTTNDRNLVNDATLEQLANELDAQFDEFPLLLEGESKIIRCVDDERVIVRLKPTLYSFSANRYALVEGTDQLRLKSSQRLWQVLIDASVPTPIHAVGDRCYISARVDAPPIEVIVKACHVGTPKHIYHGMEKFKTRDGDCIRPETRHEPYVRFDWRNPLPGKDECMPLWLANRFIDVAAAEKTALDAFAALTSFFAQRGIDLLDICFFITSDGQAVFGEISPDCMRAKYRDGDLDKDLWRKGKDPAHLVARWTEFVRIISE